MSGDAHKGPARKRGGQPGNKNNLRHGLYSKLWTAQVDEVLQESLIEDELALFRFKARALAGLTPLVKPDEAELRMFDRLIATGIAINTFERTRLLAKGKGGELGQTIWDALIGRNPNNDKE